MQERIKVLIIDDEKNLREVLQAELSAGEFIVSVAESGDKALPLLEKNEYDVLVLDLTMPGLGGIEVLKQMKAADIPAEIIILTANATVSTAVEAMKLGAYDYLRKPVDLDEFEAVIKKAHEAKKLKSECVLLKTHLKRQTEEQQLIGESPVMRDLMATVKKVARTDYAVLIAGESGVGKELIANALHRESDRTDGPFVPLNCGAIPESMIESELFGYEKGAFTGACMRKLGLLELASNGTLFLDEIGDMSPSMQVKLLRVIETARFFRLGGTRELNVNVRIISATNKDLKAELARGSFRSDLYYRIAGVTVQVPPLRERKEDIPRIVEHCKSRTQAFKHKQFSDESMKMLSGYAWPGNVRELRNVVQRALLLSKADMIVPEDLPRDLSGPCRADAGRLEDVEREHILKILAKTGGQREKAADMLGIHPRTLRRKLADYGVEQ
jgi:DNA-binding NtrC family response regulator